MQSPQIILTFFLLLHALASARNVDVTNWLPVSVNVLEEPTSFQIPSRPSKRISKTHTFYNSAHSHCLTLTTFALLLPFQSASLALFDLYEELLSNASGPWLSLPAATYFTAHRGNIYIDFAASEPYGIPWSFVAEFAEKMMDVTVKGFTGSFEGEYRHIGSGAVIRVALRVVMAAAAA